MDINNLVQLEKENQRLTGIDISPSIPDNNFEFTPSENWYDIPATDEFDPSIDPEYLAQIEHYKPIIEQYAPSSLANQNSPYPGQSVGQYDPLKQMTPPDTSTAEGALRALQLTMQTKLPEGALGPRKPQIADPIFTSKKATQFERYYNHPKFAELGFHPYASNEEYYNANSNIYDDMSRMSGQFAKLVGSGFISTYRSIGDLFGSDNYFTTPDLQTATEFEDAMAIGMSTRGGVGGFANNLFLNLGYTVGIAASIALEELILAGITAITGGGAAPVATARTGQNIVKGVKTIGQTVANSFMLPRLAQASRNMLKTLNNTDDARKFWQATKAGEWGVMGTLFAPETMAAVRSFKSGKNTAQNLTNLAKNQKFFGAFYKDLRAINLAMAESKLEGGMVYNQQIQNGIAIEQAKLNPGEVITPEIMESIAENASKASFATIMMNAPLIYFSNKIVLENALGGFNNSFSRIMNDNLSGINRRLIQTTKTVAEDGTLAKNVFEYAGEGIKGYTNALKAAGVKGSLQMGLGASLRYFSANIAEGLQELGQEAIAVGTKNYYSNLQNDSSIGGIDLFRASVSDAASSQFSSQGFETFLSGFLMGGILQGPQKLVFQGLPNLYNRVANPEKYKQYQENKKKFYERLVKNHNKGWDKMRKDPGAIFDLKTQNLAVQKEVAKEMKKSAYDKDMFGFIDAKDLGKFQQMATIFEYGTSDSFKSLIKDLLNLTDEELNTAYPSYKAEIKSGKMRQRLEDLLSDVDKYEALYNENKNQYENPYDSAKFEEGTIEHEEELLKEEAFNHARYLAMFTKYDFIRSLERADSIYNELSADPILQKIQANDLTVLLDLDTLDKELETLTAEIAVLDDSKESKKLKKEKFEKLKKLQSLKVILTDPKNLTKEGYFDRRKVSTLTKAFESYVQYLADSRDSFADVSRIDNVLKKIVDYKSLRGRAKAYDKAIQYLANPKNLDEIVERQFGVYKDIYKNNAKLFEERVKKYIGNIEINEFLNQLMKLNVYPDPIQLELFIKTGNIDYLTEFYNEKGLIKVDTKLYKLILSKITVYKESTKEEVKEETKEKPTTELDKVIDSLDISTPEIELINSKKDEHPVVKALLRKQYKLYKASGLENQLDGSEWFEKSEESKDIQKLYELLKTLWYNQKELTDEAFIKDEGFIDWLKTKKEDLTVLDAFSTTSFTIDDFINGEEPIVESTLSIDNEKSQVGNVYKLDVIKVDDATYYQISRKDNGEFSKEASDIFDKYALFNGSTKNKNTAYKVFNELEKLVVNNLSNENLDFNKVNDNTSKLFEVEPVRAFAHINGLGTDNVENREDAFRRYDLIIEHLTPEERQTLELVITKNNKTANPTNYKVGDKKPNPFIKRANSLYNIGIRIGDENARNRVNQILKELKFDPSDSQDGVFAYIPNNSVTLYDNKGNVITDPRKIDKESANNIFYYKTDTELQKIKNNFAIQFNLINFISKKLGDQNKAIISFKELENGKFSFRLTSKTGVPKNSKPKSPNALSYNRVDDTIVILDSRKLKIGDTEVRREGWITSEKDSIKELDLINKVQNDIESQYLKNNQSLYDFARSIGAYVAVLKAPNGYYTFAELKPKALEEQELSSYFKDILERAALTAKENVDKDKQPKNKAYNNDYNEQKADEVYISTMPGYTVTLRVDLMGRVRLNVYDKNNKKPLLKYEQGKTKGAITLKPEDVTKALDDIASNKTTPVNILNNLLKQLNSRKETKDRNIKITTDSFGKSFSEAATAEQIFNDTNTRLDDKVRYDYRLIINQSSDEIQASLNIALNDLLPVIKENTQKDKDKAKTPEQKLEDISLGNASSLEAQKADIERRRQEELRRLKTIKKGDRFTYTLDGINPSSVKIKVLNYTKGSGEIVMDGYNGPGGISSIFGLEYFINLKYDNELAALEQQPAPKADTSIKDQFQTIDEIKKKIDERETYLTEKVKAEKKIKELRSILANDKELNDLKDIYSKLLNNPKISNKILSGLTTEDVEDIAVFEEWAQENLPSFISIEDIKTLGNNMKTGGLRVGAFVLGLKDIAGNMNIAGTIYTGARNPYRYHEAFHSVFRMLLTDAEITKHLGLARKEVREKLRREGKNFKQELEKFRNSADTYANMSEERLKQEYYEEYLADEFEKFKVNPKYTRTNSQNKSLFTKIIEWIKSVLGLYNKNLITELFKNIDAGKYRSSKVVLNRFTEDTYQGITLEANALIPIEKIGSGDNVGYTYLDPDAANSMVRSMAAIYINREDNNTNANITRNELLDDVLKSFKELYSLDNDYDFDNMSTEKILKLSEYEQAFENFPNEIKNAVVKYLNLADIWLEDKINIADEKEDNEGLRGVDDWDKDASLIGGISSLSAKLRRYLLTTTFESSDIFGNTQLSDGEPLIVPVDFNAVYNGMLKAIQGITEPDKILKSLYIFGQNNEHTNAAVNRLFNDLGITEENILDGNFIESVKDPYFFNSVIKGLENFRVSYIFIHKNTDGRVEVYSAANRDDANTQIDKWGQAFGVVYRNKLSIDPKFKKEALSFINRLSLQLQENKVIKEITDEKLNELSKSYADGFRNYLGISLSPQYIAYNLIQKIENPTLNQSLIKEVNEGSFLIESEMLTILKESLKASTKDQDYIFSNKKEGMKGHLKKLAIANAAFDETVGNSVFKNANGDLVYAHQKPTFHLKKMKELNNAELLEELKTQPFFMKNWLLNNNAFIQMAEEGKIGVTRISGSKIGNIDLGEQGIQEYGTESSNTYGDFTPKEFITSLLNAYTYLFNSTTGKLDGVIRIEDETDPKGYKEVATAPALIKVIEASNTGDLTVLPVVKAVKYDGKSIIITDEIIEGVKNNIITEFERIKRESNEETRTQRDIEDYNKGKNKATQFVRTGYYLKPLEQKSETKINIVEQQSKIQDLFDSNPELANIGTPEQYSTYLDSIFPDSKVKDILYHGSSKKIEGNLIPSEKGTFGRGIYLTKIKKGAEDFAYTEEQLDEFGFPKLGEKSPKGSLIVAIINTKNPQNISVFSVEYDQLETGNTVFDSKNISKEIIGDSIIGDRKLNISTGLEYVVFESEQVHILGTKQDIEGFKEYLETDSTQDNVKTNQNFEQTAETPDVDYAKNLIDAIKANPNITFEEAIGDNKEFESFLRNRLEQEYQNFRKELSLIASDSELSTYITNGLKLKSGATNSNVEKSAELLNLKEDTEYNLRQIFFNDLLNTTAINQILLGEIPLTLLDPVNEIKRAKAQNAAYDSAASIIAAPEEGILHPTQRIDLFAFSEPQVDATFNKGNKTDNADAQLWMTVKAFRHAWFGFGKLNKAQNKLLDRIEKGEDISYEELLGNADKSNESYAKMKAMLNSKKLVYFDGGTFVKMSAFTLTKQFTSVKDENGKWIPRQNKVALHNLREKMEKYEEEQWKNGIGTIAMAAPVSALKMIKENIQNIDDSLSNDVTFKDGQSMILDANYLGLQTVNPSNKLKITDPTQVKNIVTSEHNDDEFVYLPGSDEPIRIGKIREYYNTAVSNRITLKYINKRNLLFNFDIDYAMNLLKESIDSNELKPDLYTYLQYASGGLEASNATSNILEMFSVDENGQQKYNLNNPQTVKKFEQLFLAFFTKGVLSEKVTGISFTLASDYGVRVYRRVFSVDENGMPDRHEIIRENVWERMRNKPEIIANIDNGAKVGDDNNLAGLAEAIKEAGDKGVVIIDRLRFNMKEYDENGNWTRHRYGEAVIPPHHTEVGNLLANTNKPIPDVVAKMFAVRIPSQDNHSTANLKVVDFMPGYYGSTGVFARELIEISGADFDIDKIYAQIKDFYVNKENKFVEYGKGKTLKQQYKDYIKASVKNANDPSSTLSQAYSKFKKFEAAHNRYILSDDIIKVQEKGLDIKTIDALLGTGLPITFNEYVDYKNKYNSEPYVEALNNDILDYKFALMGNEHVLNTPNSEVPISYQPADTKPLEDTLDILGEEFEYFANLINEGGTDVNNLGGKLKSFASNKAGANSIGAAVLPNLYLNLMKEYNIAVSNKILNGKIKATQLKLNNKLYNRFEVTKDSNGIYRTQYVISALITAMTDNAKLRLSAKLGLNKDALAVVVNTTALGVPIKTSIMLVNQPIIRDLYFKAINKTSPMDPGIATLVTKRIKALKKAFKNLELKDVTDELLGQNIRDDKPIIATGDLNIAVRDKIYTRSDAEKEYAVLKQFKTAHDIKTYNGNVGTILTLSKSLGKDMQDVNRKYQAVIDLGLTLNEKEYKEYTDFKIRAGLPAIDVRPLFEGTWQGRYLDIFKELKHYILPEVFLTQSPGFITILNRALGETSFINRDKIEIIKDDLLSYLTIKGYQQKLYNSNYGSRGSLFNSILYPQIEGEKITDVIERLSNLSPDNYFLRTFVIAEKAIDAGNRSGIDKITSNTFNKLSDQDKVILQTAFAELYGNLRTRKDAKNIIHYIMVKDGFKLGYGSLLDAITPFVYNDFLLQVDTVEKALRNNKDDEFFKETFGLTYDQLINDFVKGYFKNVRNKDVLNTLSGIRTYNPKSKASAKNFDRSEIVYIEKIDNKRTLKINLYPGRDINESLDEVSLRVPDIQAIDEDLSSKIERKRGLSEVKVFSDYGEFTEVELPTTLRIQIELADRTDFKYFILSKYQSVLPSDLKATVPTGNYAEYIEFLPEGSYEQWAGAFMFANENQPLPTNLEVTKFVKELNEQTKPIDDTSTLPDAAFIPDYILNANEIEANGKEIIVDGQPIDKFVPKDFTDFETVDTFTIPESQELDEIENMMVYTGDPEVDAFYDSYASDPYPYLREFWNNTKTQRNKLKANNIDSYESLIKRFNESFKTEEEFIEEIKTCILNG